MRFLKSVNSAPGIFCAIDTPDLGVAEDLVSVLAATPLHVKLGLEFFTSQGPEGVRRIRACMRRDALLFLDLKLHDIPNTVAGAVGAAAGLGADFITLHASGGMEMMQAACHAAAGKVKLLGVTVLTSLDDTALQSAGQETPVEKQVLRLARLAHQSGLEGIVCSPWELAAVRRHVPPAFLCVVPGIRPEGAKADDQKRIMTPRQAAEAGADYLVVGRPVTAAGNPAEAAKVLAAGL
jgi:orotidine-5'-phosphate decarboxylase